MESKDQLVLWMDGEWLPESGAKVSIFDNGFLRADAAFDAARTFGGRPFQLDEHVDRLIESCRFLRLELAHDRNELLNLGREVVARNSRHVARCGDFWVDYHVTRGIDRPGFKKGPSVMVYCDPIPFRERGRYFQEGISIFISAWRRTPPWSISPRVKTHNYMNFVMAGLQSKSNGGAWPMLLDENGNLSEGNSANIFLVKNGVLSTPQERYVLPGVSRSNVIKLAHKLKIEVRETDLDLRDLYLADEVFLTSTSLCLCGVSKVDGHAVKALFPGPMTTKLMSAYNELVGLNIRDQYLSFL